MRSREEVRVVLRESCSAGRFSRPPRHLLYMEGGAGGAGGRDEKTRARARVLNVVERYYTEPKQL